jgi:hypothetical protein
LIRPSYVLGGQEWKLWSTNKNWKNT